MRGVDTWSYAPYRPFLYNVGDIYICRIAPAERSIRFEWLSAGGSYSVFYRIRGNEEFLLCGTTDCCEYDIENLIPETDYEFFVESKAGKSRVRLARTGNTVGTVVNYLHPDDDAYAFSGRYLCSPSLVRHPDGYLLASMDLFADKHPQNLTLIYRSDDEGKTWHYVSELMPCFWGKMFIHKGELYMLACSTEYGDLLIGKSVDGGKTFSTPVTLLRGANGKNGSSGVHKNPQNLIYHGGRLWATLEWGAWANREYCHAAMMMSCGENADLLDPASWVFTEPRIFEHFVPELEDVKIPAMTIEGTPVISPDGKLFNIMRFGKRGYALCYEADVTEPEKMLSYSYLMRFPANFSKFMIKYDAVSGKYYSIVCRLYEGCSDSARNLQTLMSSRDLVEWRDERVLYDLRGYNRNLVGLQYVDFEFDREDIIYLCRTAINGAHSFHDSNYSTFHRIKNFRNISK
ncbi:MAG: hypothetical protein E7608_02810 [Ruminococcaceae bacterium]|nr:hypothetical protein [Oscillospiraceae bacterium]